METNNQDQVKDLQYFLDEVSEEMSFRGYDHACEFHQTLKFKECDEIQVIHKEAAERYAAHLVQQAKDAAWNEGFEAGYNHQYAVKGKTRPPSPYTTREKGGEDTNQTT